jgi:hypothetical protein
MPARALDGVPVELDGDPGERRPGRATFDGKPRHHLASFLLEVPVPATAQPGKHWITLDQLSNHVAARALFTIAMSWPQGGWGASWRGWNPLEDTLDPI